MSLIKLNDERVFMGFATFLSLSESIKPKETEYGTDSKNGEWDSSILNHHHTFFSHRPDHHVLVTLNHRSGELAFATHHGDFSTDVWKHYSNERQNRDDSFTVLGKALHVGLDGAKKHGMKHLVIKGADDGLRHAYKTFLKNKFLQKHLEDNGYRYSHSDNDAHHFERIEHESN